jgi:hypothetical protein
MNFKEIIAKIQNPNIMTSMRKKSLYSTNAEVLWFDKASL